jgi:uncharacterized protein (TIGR04255 family)
MATEMSQVLDQLPKAEPVTYPKNLIDKVVCELRFPTVYGLQRGQPPVSLAAALRKSFPDHRSVDGVNVGPGGVAQDFGFVFTDKKQRLSVSFRASAISVEASAYRSFEELIERVTFVANAAKEVIDTEFFTRVGLRYINLLPCDESAVGDWVNPALVAPLASRVLPNVAEYSGRIASTFDGGGFLFQHGIGQAEGDKPRYVLDYDVWAEDVPFNSLAATMQCLHELEFRLFHWSLGKAAFAHMGPGKPKVETKK